MTVVAVASLIVLVNYSPVGDTPDSKTSPLGLGVTSHVCVNQENHTGMCIQLSGVAGEVNVFFGANGFESCSVQLFGLAPTPCPALFKK